MKNKLIVLFLGLLLRFVADKNLKECLILMRVVVKISNLKTSVSVNSSISNRKNINHFLHVGKECSLFYSLTSLENELDYLIKNKIK
jgi:hypothetical protein